jgi:Glyoxalase/Bleomycin resistance protein/Dioxygenase superfamily
MPVNPKPSRADCARCWTRTDRCPIREPVFNETLQLGIVVRDLEATIRRYVDDYGIGPWEVYEFDAGKAEDFREYGQPVERSWRLAVATFGQVQWELIEPLDEESVYARFSPRWARASTMSPSPLRTSTRPLRRPTGGTA